MNDHMETLYAFSDLLDSEINKIVKRGTINPSELEAADKAVCLLIKIDNHLDGNEDSMASGEWGYSHMPRFNRSYGTNDNRAMNLSYKRSMSGHSIKDRMIARLEGMYDEAQTDHERQMIEAEIHKIRNSEE